MGTLSNVQVMCLCLALFASSGESTPIRNTLGIQRAAPGPKLNDGSLEKVHGLMERGSYYGLNKLMRLRDDDDDVETKGSLSEASNLGTHGLRNPWSLVDSKGSLSEASNLGTHGVRNSRSLADSSFGKAHDHMERGSYTYYGLNKLMRLRDGVETKGSLSEASNSATYGLRKSLSLVDSKGNAVEPPHAFGLISP